MEPCPVLSDPHERLFFGAFLSESLAYHIKRLHFIRWDTLLVFLEMLAVVFLGLLPETAPFQISQITINFICSMQYNTFRQTQSIPMATTFCTNHLRQTGVAFCMALRHRDRAHLTRMGAHLGMLLVFVAGGVAATILCRLMQGQAHFRAAFAAVHFACRPAPCGSNHGKGRLGTDPRRPLRSGLKTDDGHGAYPWPFRLAGGYGFSRACWACRSCRQGCR